MLFLFWVVAASLSLARNARAVPVRTPVAAAA
jgi:hypothetical protein